MRLRLPGIAVLATVLMLPSIAAADVMDDFSVVGNGVDITFSLPATNVVDVPLSYNYWYATFPEIKNGVPQTGSLFFAINDPFSCYSLNPSTLAGINVCRVGDGSMWSTPGGATPLPPSSGYAASWVVAFNPGTYVDYVLVGPVGSFDYAEYTITITPEGTPTGVTPEPGTLALLSTALAGGITLRRRKVTR